jgi:RimJ/RimL family protein N-acetyltransferase
MRRYRPQPIETERLLLRRSRPEDAATISAYRSDPNVNRQQGWDRTDLEGVLADIIEMSGRSPGEPGGWVQFTVEERGGGRIVGDVGLSVADGEPGVVKVGYTIDPAFQGLGYATEAIRALVEYAFETLGAELVRAHASARTRRRSGSPRKSGCDSWSASSTERATRSGTAFGTSEGASPSRTRGEPAPPQGCDRRGLNSSQVSELWITPRTYRHPPIDRRGNMNLHSPQLNFGFSALR